MTTNTRKQKEKMETQSAITVCHHPQIFVLWALQKVKLSLCLTN
jgi:hypothetical protein